MPRKLRIAKQRIQGIADDELFFLSDRLLGEAPEKNTLRLFLLKGDDNAAKNLWDAHRDTILAAWIRTYPGTRPALWWKFDAPENRRCLGGTGSPNHEVLAYAPSFEYGLPASGWLTQDTVDMYNGRRRDIHGNLITCDGKWFEGHFEGVAINPNDPPRFESQAAYLKRHGLLTPEEVRRLKARDFEVEVVLPEIETATSVQ